MQNTDFTFLDGIYPQAKHDFIIDKIMRTNKEIHDLKYRLSMKEQNLRSLKVENKKVLDIINKKEEDIDDFPF